ncbi:MAG: TlpA family protein disulfide reductase [Deltaproteobacteria bacterium]|nr:TlpA family protein disulfide reductase [Deltaproteobacteria bacterium]
MRFLKPFTIYCLIFIALIACTKADKDTGETLIGKSAPHFRLKDIHGKEVGIADMKGKVILLRFWSTRCISCKEEMPKLETSYKNLNSKGFEILAVNVEDTKEKALGFAHELNLTYPILIDENQSAANIYKIYGVPTSFFIDKQGIIRERIFGELDSKAIENIILPLLEGKTLTTQPQEEKHVPAVLPSNGSIGGIKQGKEDVHDHNQHNH